MKSPSASNHGAPSSTEGEASDLSPDIESTGAGHEESDTTTSSAAGAEPQAGEGPRTVGSPDASSPSKDPPRPVSDSTEQPSPAEPLLGDEPAPEAKAPSPAEELDRVRDQLLRVAADFDNFRKRSRKEIADAEKQGRSELLRELLPVFDNLERATAHANSTTDVQALADGIALVMRQFLDTLSRAGIERVATVGVPFDPMVHEAIQHLPTTEHAPGTVAAEVQAGYRMGDRLVRPAMVVVAKEPAN